MDIKHDMSSVDLQVLRTALEGRKNNHRVDRVTVIMGFFTAPAKRIAGYQERRSGRRLGIARLCGRRSDRVNAQCHAEQRQVGVVPLWRSGSGSFHFDVRWHTPGRQLKLETSQVRLASARRMADVRWQDAVYDSWTTLLVADHRRRAIVALSGADTKFSGYRMQSGQKCIVGWAVPSSSIRSDMSDDLVLVQALELDPHSVVVAGTYDSKLDDMALLEALRCRRHFMLGRLVHVQIPQCAARVVRSELEINRPAAWVNRFAQLQSSAARGRAPDFAEITVFKDESPHEPRAGTSSDHHASAEIFGDSYAA